MAAINPPVNAADFLDALINKTAGLAADDMAQARALVEAETARFKWVPNPGPQTDAYFSEADQTLYGGEVGGGKLMCFWG